MLADRNINRPSYVLALLLGVVALYDAYNALLGLQGTDAGWSVDLLTSGICSILVALLLLRPHLYVFLPVVLWSLLAFVANFIMRTGKGIDEVATVRMALYFVTFVGAGVLLIVEGQKWVADTWARRPYSSQYAAPPAPPAPPAAPPAPPAPPAPTAPAKAAPKK